MWTKLLKAREVEVESEEETEIEVDGGAKVEMGRWVFGAERRGFWGGGGFTKNLEILVEVKVVEGTSKERDIEEDVVEGGGGEFTTVEEREGEGSTGRKMMPVGFCFFGASFGTAGLGIF